MLIVKTERLHRRRASMPAADSTEAALNLAVEQRMIRAEFVFMLGGEVEDEEVEAEQSTELQAGRLQNRGQRDLRAATDRDEPGGETADRREHRARRWWPSAPRSPRCSARSRAIATSCARWRRAASSIRRAA